MYMEEASAEEAGVEDDGEEDAGAKDDIIGDASGEDAGSLETLGEAKEEALPDLGNLQCPHFQEWYDVLGAPSCLPRGETEATTAITAATTTTESIAAPK